MQEPVILFCSGGPRISFWRGKHHHQRRGGGPGENVIFYGKNACFYAIYKTHWYLDRNQTIVGVSKKILKPILFIIRN